TVAQTAVIGRVAGSRARRGGVFGEISLAKLCPASPQRNKAARPFRQFAPVAWSIGRTLGIAVLQLPVDPVDAIHARLARGGFPVPAILRPVLPCSVLRLAELVSLLQQRYPVRVRRHARQTI